MGPVGSGGVGMPAAGARPRWPDYPYRDLRLWAVPVSGAALAAVANSAATALLPGREPATPVLALAAAALGALCLGLALHPRARHWTAEGNVAPSVLAALAAAAVAPPVAGPGFWAFAWAAIVLLLVWSRCRGLVRTVVRLAPDLAALPQVPPRGRRRPLLPRWWPGWGRTPQGGVGGTPPASDPGAAPGLGEAAPSPLAGARAPRSTEGQPFAVLAGAALLDGLLLVGAWVALSDGGAGDSGGAAREVAAAVAAAGVLALAAWIGRAEVLRRAAGEGSAVQADFARLWWWAAAPALTACLLVGSAFPLYPAPLQGPTLARWITTVLGHLLAGAPLPAARATPARLHAQAVTGLGLTGLWMLLLLLLWPAQRWLRRVLNRPGARPRSAPRPHWVRRLRLWWARLAGRRRPGPPPLAHGRWWPVGQPAPRPGGPPPRIAAAAWGPDDWRGRVRAAYVRVLREAATVGMGRQASQTPRRFLAALLVRATAARFPLESLTAAYERARFSRHPLGADAAVRAEDDARAAAYGIALSARSERARHGVAPRDEGLRWSAPRGVRGLRRDAP